MKAIVLSFDDQLEVANFLAESYNHLWPGSPLTFRIPYTERNPLSVLKAAKVEPIFAFRHIRATMEALLRGIPDEEFVYWCIGDRYPIEIYDLPAIVAAQDHVGRCGGDVDALRITAPFRPERNVHTFAPNDHRIISGVTFQRLVGRNLGFYMPQFLRAGILRSYFFHPSLPEHYSIREFHMLLESLPINYRIYLPDRFLIKLGEATVRGLLTSECAKQMAAMGLALPKIAITEVNRTYG